MQNYCRIAPSIGKLDGDPHKVWRTLPYTPDTNPEHLTAPCVFFGIYGLNDFFTLWRHKGKRWILWAGSDIRHFKDGYWLDEKGTLRMHHRQLAPWIKQNCESWVENEVERDELRKLGVPAKVCPSFVGDIDEYKLSFKTSDKTRVYASVSGDDFNLYGWDELEFLAYKHPDIEFHLYGNTIPFERKYQDLPNFIVHGRVPKETMNEEVKDMQAAIRPLEFDGFSEVLAKSVLWGQWPIAKIEYPHMLRMGGLAFLAKLKEPNIKGRDHYIKSLNKFPWVQ